MSETSVKEALDAANSYAKYYSTCVKVQVGSVIETTSGLYVYGCNHGVMNCKKNGCRRIRLYGENSKNHRLPSDCDALHSEVDAICKAVHRGINLTGATIYVTRYPCESCARAIAESGIKQVYYGRGESISDYTKTILDYYGVKIEKIDWTEEDNNA